MFNMPYSLFATAASAHLVLILVYPFFMAAFPFSEASLACLAVSAFDYSEI